MKNKHYFEDKKAYDAYIRKWRIIQSTCIVIFIVIFLFLIYLVLCSLSGVDLAVIDATSSGEEY